eukprot:TRINITY_DN45067_c0_g1_i1.p2 TRINITY_DN45067_c0_g1~~TRINITY_DN45067_c0_g1_i1.p2  ORF type:complete len:133 (+),score=31.47 TRINITY_DN45067_c0_g1_i1:83-481(+)
MEQCAPEQEGEQRCCVVDTEGEPLSESTLQLTERPAPPPRRVGRPVLGRGAGSSRPESATPPPRELGQDDDDTIPRRTGDAIVERLTQQIQQLKEALAAAGILWGRAPRPHPRPRQAAAGRCRMAIFVGRHS